LTITQAGSLKLRTHEHTAQYDGAIANYLGQEEDGFSHTINLQFNKTQSMRYGENPHQSAAFYIEKNITEACVASSRQCQGKEMSYNNMADADAALECVRSFNEPACVIVKHVLDRTFLASLSTFGAMITSTNWRSIMACAVFSFKLRLKAIMPPNAEVGSVLKASL
jgi:hypothetical protein